MAINFEEFDAKIDKEQLKADIGEAQKNNPQYKEVTPGMYLCRLENLELGTTKDNRPMLRAMFRIKGDEDGNSCEFDKHCLFYNRVVYGTKNDANMIASALGWLESLEPSEDVGDITFESYSQFADLIMDIAEDVCDDLEYVVEYDPDAWNTVSIECVTEI